MIRRRNLFDKRFVGALEVVRRSMKEPECKSARGALNAGRHVWDWDPDLKRRFCQNCDVMELLKLRTNERGAWITFAAAAIGSQIDSKLAAETADTLLEEFRKRLPSEEAPVRPPADPPKAQR